MKERVKKEDKCNQSWTTCAVFSSSLHSRGLGTLLRELITTCCSHGLRDITEQAELIPCLWGITTFKAVFPCCLQTWICHCDRCEVGNVKRLLGAVCVDDFVLCSYPDVPSTWEESFNLMEGRNTSCHRTAAEFKITEWQRKLPLLLPQLLGICTFIFPSWEWSGMPLLLWAEAGNFSPTQILLLLKLIGKTSTDCSGVTTNLWMGRMN